MKYLVPVDGSPNSNLAFNTALKVINKEKDVLFILNVIEDLLVYSGFPDAPVSVYSAAQEYAKSESKKTLLKYTRVCLDEKINYKTISSISNHVGDAICHIIDEYGIDFLIIGRRGMSKLKRFFIGSTSRYCVEHANANVIVVKEGAMEDFMEPSARKHEVVSSTEQPGEHLKASSAHPTDKGKEEVGVQSSSTSSTFKSAVIPPAPPNPIESSGIPPAPPNPIDRPGYWESKPITSVQGTATIKEPTQIHPHPILKHSVHTPHHSYDVETRQPSFISNSPHPSEKPHESKLHESKLHESKDIKPSSEIQLPSHVTSLPSSSTSSSSTSSHHEKQPHGLPTSFHHEPFKSHEYPEVPLLHHEREKLPHSAPAVRHADSLLADKRSSSVPDLPSEFISSSDFPSSSVAQKSPFGAEKPQSHVSSTLGSTTSGSSSSPSLSPSDLSSEGKGPTPPIPPSSLKEQEKHSFDISSGSLSSNIPKEKESSSSTLKGAASFPSLPTPLHGVSDEVKESKSKEPESSSSLLIHPTEVDVKKQLQLSQQSEFKSKDEGSKKKQEKQTKIDIKDVKSSKTTTTTHVKKEYRPKEKSKSFEGISSEKKDEKQQQPSVSGTH